MNSRKCSDCGSELEKGWVPDQSYGGVHRGTWHRGEVARVISFGLIKIGIHYNKQETIPITAYRCTNCGLLKSYAWAADGE